MEGFLRQMAKSVPSTSRMVNEALNPSKSLNVQRQDIIVQRAAYYLRKAVNYGDVYQAAKPEFRALIQKLKTPGEFTGRQLVVGFVCGVHIIGSFCVGEMCGRHSIIGYNPGKSQGHH